MDQFDVANQKWMSNSIMFTYIRSWLTVSNISDYEVSSFTRSKVTEGSQNLKSRSRDSDHAPFDPKMLFCVEFHLGILLTKFGASRLIVWQVNGKS